MRGRARPQRDLCRDEGQHIAKATKGEYGQGDVAGVVNSGVN